MIRHVRISHCWKLIAALACLAEPSTTDALDLSNAVVLTPANLSAPERKAVSMLLDEVENRTQIRWSSATEWPAKGRTVIAVGQASALKPFAEKVGREVSGSPIAEGYRIA